ncbi:MAG: TlpA family protein disulfide reductase [Candidatus Brockarchaeota archaeon]|nr:TlpA family protein disulfide reductase [Candidatus Brockarchaeota archaeon]
MGWTWHRRRRIKSREKNILRWLIISSITILITGVAWQFLQHNAACGSQTEAPDFSLKSLDGKNFRLKDFKGRVILLDFMATWCGPCRASMPSLKALWNEQKEWIVMLSISVDPIYDTEEVLKDWVNEWGAEWMHARDTADPPASQSYRITAIPTYVIIDKNGCVRHRHVGVTSKETISQEISALLKE